MVRFKTEEDIKKYFKEQESVQTREFQDGAKWAVKMNEEYIAYLLKRIASLSNKIQELNNQITDYEVTYFGAEPISTKKVRKKSNASSTDEVERDEMLAEMESMYGISHEDEDDYRGDFDSYGYDD